MGVERGGVAVAAGAAALLSGGGARAGQQADAEQRFRALLEAAPDAMVIVDEAGTIKLVNAQTEAVFGYPRQELLGRPVEVLVPGRFRADHPAHRTGYAANQQVRPMGAGLDLYGVRRDGSEFPVEISLSPLATSDGLLVSAAVRDVSDRKAAEERINEFELIVESSQDAILTKTLDGVITFWNAAAARMYGRAGGHRVHEEPGTAGEDLIRPERIGDDRAAGAEHHRDSQAALRHWPRRRPALQWGGAWRPRVGRPHRHQRPGGTGPRHGDTGQRCPAQAAGEAAPQGATLASHLSCVMSAGSGCARGHRHALLPNGTGPYQLASCTPSDAADARRHGLDEAECHSLQNRDAYRLLTLRGSRGCRCVSRHLTGLLTGLLPLAR
jgi:PAS domain S-box-containing protein